MTAVARKVREYGPGELEAAEVTHACSTDPNRLHLHTPFGCLLGGHGFICATDGHRVAAVRSDEWRAYQRTDAPRLDAVLAKDWTEVGELGNGSEEGDSFPASWVAQVTLHPSGTTTLSAFIEKGPKKNRRRVRILTDVKVEWLAHHLRLGTEAVGFHLSYLVDAMAHVGTITLFAHAPAGAKGKVDTESPFIFTPTAAHPFENRRFALVMPCRL